MMGQMAELVTRHYIALTSMGRLTMTLGPDKPEAFAKVAPGEPIPLGDGDTLAYPVSAEIAAEWTADDEDEDDHDGGNCKDCGHSIDVEIADLHDGRCAPCAGF